ncbi:MAG: transketolase family protein [Chlorobium sp.]|jgi:transketolase|uniref:transketolase family protein n=1 Tax=Chlorobium sp. TaxID=1095 RepID=UPI0025B8C0EE|nr:transketolase family protein [Chlorobium sp.]MCF8216907.1 transketolase family protein [Chlorobium sp.]MCF8271727.1 transketolase family protein [Chlorobium sp.]MCF8288115.1 transketolase family protein [Chlorobium sp.]MCF8291706.1 transketolase family protein [Chlorobium sp.]MCF8385807.1 transketolase family protein [Chlorobium sp.]
MAENIIDATALQYVSRGNKATRTGFGEALLEIGRESSAVVGLCADLTGSLNMNKFRDAFPDRFFQTGIAEANMISMAAGLATTGKIPFAASFAVFATGRVYDQIRQSVCYSNLNVKICASHAGLTLGEDGATHQILEDIGLMRGLPRMTVVVPCDYSETKRATKAVAKLSGPVYLRFGRPNVPDFTLDEDGFEIGKSIELHSGTDVTVIACGIMVWKALEAARILEKEGVGVRVINMHTIKPIDTLAIVRAANDTGAIVTAEEHQINNGLGDAVAAVCARNIPVPVEMVGVEDQFGESGKPDALLEKYKLTTADILEKIYLALRRK